MKDRRLRILFDARTLRPGAYNNSARSGIFFTALNILKNFANNENIKLALVVPVSWEHDIKKVLQKEFNDKKFDIFVYEDKSFFEQTDIVSYVLAQDRNILCANFVKLLLKTIYFVRYLPQIIRYCLCLYKYRNYDIYFSAAHAKPDALKNLASNKTYTLLHDVIPLVMEEYYEFNKGNAWFFEVIDSLNSKDYYFTNSDYTKQDFLKYASQIDTKKIHTIYLGCKFDGLQKQGDIVSVKNKYGIPQDKKYLFSLCTIEPRKNLVRIIKTYFQFVKKHNIKDLIFVMGGGNYPEFKKELDKILKDEKLTNIYQIGYVDDEDLPLLYSGAEWFTFTSQYEGFGLPVLEAMNCGCPVITSNSSSLPEVIGDAGIQIDWDSDDEHIEAYEKYYFNEELRKENSKKGLERAKLFTWKKTTDKMLEIMMK